MCEKEKIMTSHTYDLNTLIGCIDEDKIDNMLNEIGIPDNPEDRTTILYQFMGINQPFTCGTGVATPEEEYTFAKKQLVFMNMRLIN